jgi:hypothetical protein
MKSLFIILFFTLIVYLSYKYSYNKYYTDNIETSIKYIILPQTINDSFKKTNLEDDFKYVFNDTIIDNNYKTIENNDTETNTFSLQRFFTEF